MNKNKRLFLFGHLLLAHLFIFLAMATPTANATPTIWNGSTITFTHSTATGNLQDQLTSGVTLTRSSSGGGLYNAMTESGAVSGTSPEDTAWAIGSLANYNTLTYGPCPLEAGNHPPGYVNTTFVVHLINEDIYLSLKLTAWGGQGGSGDKSFTYIRSTPAIVVVPTVTITNPAAGAVFAAPASLKLGANASVSGGTVTNVEFFANAAALGSVTAAPFNFTSTSLNAGAYSLTAVATASGISATSPPVNVTVVNPAPVNVSTASVNGDQFSFDYTADAGLAYVIQSSSNLVDWVSLATNVASSSSALFSDSFNSNGMRFYRVGRLPNP
jgi:Bacterial Ig domain